MNDYKPAARPAAFGAAAVALTAITIAFAVVLPAKMDSASREVRTVAAPLPSSAPAADLAAGPIRIEVVASRSPAVAPVHARLSVPKSKQHADRMGTHAVAAPERLGDTHGFQRAVCPYLINGTVAATS